MLCNVSITTVNGSGICGGANVAFTPAYGTDPGKENCASGLSASFACQVFTEKLSCSIGKAIPSSQGDGQWVCLPGPIAYVTNATYVLTLPTSTSPSLTLYNSEMHHVGQIIAVISSLTIGLLLLVLLWYKAGPENLDSWCFCSRRCVNNTDIPHNQAERYDNLDAMCTCAPAELLLPPCRDNTHYRTHYLDLQTQRQWLFQLLISLILEFSYVALAIIVSIESPGIIFSGLSIAHLAEAKGITTLLTISWQSLALFPVQSVLSTVFASEWSHCYECIQELKPGKIDCVSIKTSGILDQIGHFCSTNASQAFHSAFMASLAAMALAAVAPAALSIGLVFVPKMFPIAVGAITTVTGAQYAGDVISRAGTVTRQELLDHMLFGFTISDPGTIISWPQQSSLIGIDKNLTYQSDIVQFKHVCHWAAPGLANMSGGAHQGIITQLPWVVEGKSNIEDVWTIFLQSL